MDAMFQQSVIFYHHSSISSNTMVAHYPMEHILVSSLAVPEARPQ
jgi:hypothetical protein